MLVRSTNLEVLLFLPFFLAIGIAINAPIISKLIYNHFVLKLNNTIYYPYNRIFIERYVLVGSKASLYYIKFSNKTYRLSAYHTINLPLLFSNREVYNGVKILEGFLLE